ncbi:MAG: pyridoxal 5'-phosphate synthase glutaminase subunit PdxT [Bryobacterales bacterium]|nr:pyridoxal 5'-phosphate synthase glutaminase subunit PdxT [Bryobacteraceae bacterium]MDW8352919.1 pyridoxal 5'-phosphate synthase glutaminase subunit PdxT [Bryobacterales bacterium]
MTLRVGVLALQGDFDAHCRAVERAGAAARLVRTAAELDAVDGLILPGGESTTMLTLLREERLFEPLREFGRRRPIFGTCAGAILLAREVSHPQQESLELMDIAVERNAYGRQLNSHVARIQPEEEFLRRTGGGELETVFIRAPVIRRAGEAVKVLARYRGDPVLVEQGLHLAATFHPELTEDNRVHRLFLAKL